MPYNSANNLHISKKIVPLQTQIKNNAFMKKLFFSFIALATTVLAGLISTRNRFVE